MHVRRKSSPAERALETARVAKDLGSRAGEAAQQINERAQATVVPAVGQAAKTASEHIRHDVQPAVATAAATVAATAAAAAEAAREEARARGKDARERSQQALKDVDKRTKKTRRQAKKRGLVAADRARAAVGLEPAKPERHWLRTIVVALGLAGGAAYVANKARGSAGPEPVTIPTTPTPYTPAATTPVDEVIDEPVAVPVDEPVEPVDLAGGEPVTGLLDEPVDEVPLDTDGTADDPDAASEKS